MTSCKSGRKHMHPKPNKSRKVNRKPIKSRKGKGRKGSRKGRKGSKKSKKALGRFNQLKSMIESRLGMSREAKPSLKLESQITDFNDLEDIPDNCRKYDKPVIPCNQKTEKERKTNWRTQSMLFHPDKVPQECRRFTDGKIALLNNCCDRNDSYKKNKNCEL